MKYLLVYVRFHRGWNRCNHVARLPDYRCAAEQLKCDATLVFSNENVTAGVEGEPRFGGRWFDANPTRVLNLLEDCHLQKYWGLGASR